MIGLSEGAEPGAAHAGLDWREHVEIDPRYFRPAEVEALCADASKARRRLGWEPAVTFHSPFTLPAAIDYLDAVWRLRFANHLVSPPGVERSARLAFTATSAEEADSRFSALAELLKGLNVPGVEGIGGHPLARLGPFLESKLPDESHDRIREAVALLDAARQVRAGAQHAGARSKSIDAFTLLGLGFPVYDWPAAWEHVQVVAATAFDSIRDEIQAAPTEEP